MSWEFDAAEGVYKDHALSAKIREAAVADSQFVPFASPEQGYGKGKGASVTITQVLNLPLAGKVGELDRLPSGRAAVQTINQAVSEWGYKVELTEFEENLTYFDMRNKQQRALRNQIRLTMDKMVADALKTTPVKAVSTGAGTLSFETGSALIAGTATNNLDIGHLRLIHDYMHGTLKIPPFKNGKYIGILSTKPARGIKNDDDYKDWLAPSTFRPFVTGQLEREIEGFTLIETNHYDALDNTIGTGNTGEAVFFGDDAAFLASVQDPELRVGLTEDLGRFREIGWVGTLDAGLVWQTAAYARAVHWGSIIT